MEDGNCSYFQEMLYQALQGMNSPQGLAIIGSADPTQTDQWTSILTWNCSMQVIRMESQLWTQLFLLWAWHAKWYCFRDCGRERERDSLPIWVRVCSYFPVISSLMEWNRVHPTLCVRTTDSVQGPYCIQMSLLRVHAIQSSSLTRQAENQLD